MKSILEIEKIPALSSERETIDYFWVKKDFALVGNEWMYSAAGLTALLLTRCKSSGAGFKS